MYNPPQTIIVGSLVMRNFSAFFFLACIAITFIGCAGPQVSPAAKKVEMRNDTPDDTRYEHLGEVSCERGGNFRSQTRNAQQCRAEIRENAAQRGADVMVMVQEDLGRSICENCVYLMGNIYRKMEND